MGSKNNPGKFDCYSRAEPDEPVFVLLGRDPVASVVVQVWASLRERLDPDDPKCDEAIFCASDMATWALSKGKHDQVKLARASYRAELEEVHLTRVSGEVDRLSERVRELESLCGRAADTIAEQVSINVADGGLRGRQELDDLVRELRGA